MPCRYTCPAHQANAERKVARYVAEMLSLIADENASRKAAGQPPKSRAETVEWLMHRATWIAVSRIVGGDPPQTTMADIANAVIDAATPTILTAHVSAE